MAIAFDRHVKPIDMLRRRRAWRTENPNAFNVFSRDGHTKYRVFVVNGVSPSIACQCEAGVHSSPCFHATLVMRRLMREKKL